MMPNCYFFASKWCSRPFKYEPEPMHYTNNNKILINSALHLLICATCRTSYTTVYKTKGEIILVFGKILKWIVDEMPSKIKINKVKKIVRV